MRKKLLVIVSIIIIGAVTGIGLGLFFWWNPLGAANEEIESGIIRLEGTFVVFDSSHYGHGTVQIVDLPNGDRLVQFIDVDIANGPDLWVYLSDKSSFSGISDSPGNYKSLGLLPYITGNFSVDTMGTTLTNVNSVLIWCKQFAVAFTYAPLS
ncbi:MAG: DM13 domain-containing protein [Promethearchaeota archaeon]|jgi:hypothetical protein